MAMAKDLSQFPYCEIQFTKDGAVFDLAEKDKAIDLFSNKKNGVTDLFVFSHGWNNNLDEARGLYDRFFKCMRDTIDQCGKRAGVEDRKFAVLGILWPSMKWTD